MTAIQSAVDAGRCGPGAAANALAETGRLAEEALDLGAAERALDRAIALRPKYADLHFRRAGVLLRGGRRADARRALDQALTIHPGYVAACLERAMLDAREGFVGEALETLRGMAGAAAADTRAFDQGIRRLEHAEWDEADSLLRRALSLKDQALEDALRDVRAVLDGGDARGAVVRLRTLLPKHAAFPDLHALLGRAGLSLGHFDDAIVSLSRALELNPGYHGARVLLAHALEGAGQLAEAQEQVALVLEADPNHAEALECTRRWSRPASTGTHGRRAG